MALRHRTHEGPQGARAHQRCPEKKDRANHQRNATVKDTNWYRDIEIRIGRLEDTVANLYAQVQSIDSEIFLVQTELKDLEILLKEEKTEAPQ